jgi:hypothetical protein
MILYSVSGDLPGREQYPSSLDFQPTLGAVHGLHHNNDILDLIEELSGCMGRQLSGMDQEEKQSDDQDQN